MDGYLFTMESPERGVRGVWCMAPVKCPFCNPIAEDIVARNELCYALWDRYPVSRGHLLVVPFRHTPDFFR